MLHMLTTIADILHTLLQVYLDTQAQLALAHITIDSLTRTICTQSALTGLADKIDHMTIIVSYISTITHGTNPTKAPRETPSGLPLAKANPQPTNLSKNYKKSKTTNVQLKTVSVPKEKQQTQVEPKQKGRNRSKSPVLAPLPIHNHRFFAARASLEALRNREKATDKIPGIAARALATTGCSIERIAITYIINDSTETILLTMD